jgi:haloalkane dehalogenase
MPTIDVLDSTIHYEVTGSGTPFVFLHGNSTSSHLWRNVLPRIGDLARSLSRLRHWSGASAAAEPAA